MLPSTLDKLTAIVDKAELFLPIGGQYLKIATVGLHALAGFLDSSGADLAELDALHVEYQRRIALARESKAAHGG
jgi:hypothetical protein